MLISLFPLSLRLPPPHSGKHYFFHLRTQVSQWSEPAEWGRMLREEEEAEEDYRREMERWRREKEEKERMHRLKERAAAFRYRECYKLYTRRDS